MVHWHLDHSSEIINAEIYKGKLDKLVATTNFRAFYMEMREILVDFGFKDMLGNPNETKLGIFFEHQAARGEFVENKTYLNRVADVYEKKFMWSKKADSTVEMEMEWYARYKTPHSRWGWCEVKIYLVCRRIVNVEVLDGNNKKILQQGSWEFRNEYTYKNNIVTQYLNTVPIVKNSHLLKDIYLEHLYEKTLDQELDFCQHEIIPLIKNIIKKYFVSE